MSRAAKVGIALAVLLGAGVVVAAVWRGLHPPGTPVKVALAEERTFEDKVLATGKVEPEEEIDVTSPIAAKLLRLAVREGDRVKAGQLLAELDTGDLEDKVKSAQAALAVAEAELLALRQARPEDIAQAEAAVREAEESLEEARAVADTAQKKLERYRFLRNQGAVSVAELEAVEAEAARAQAQVRAAEARLESARARLQALKNPDPQKIAVQEARVNQARVALEEARCQLAKGKITAPADGVVLQIGPREGDFLQPGAFILKLGDVNRVRVVAELSEQDLAGIKAGQRGVVTWSAYPGKEWSAVVERLSPMVTRKSEQGAETIFKVYLRPEKEGLLPGARVDVSIYRALPRKSVLVPLEAVFGSDREKFVMVVENGVVRRQKVTVGGSNELYTEIKEGLKPGTMVVLNPRQVKEGERVRPEGLPGQTRG
ncbi:efflux transporter, RND family, MFP subunit [Ammonifex degensii KC4]|uniref:Efflux transporter, RND family, MFP subunit n=1 Tax=Ammonifex degensii (strain DSM 10501 / KC4) TaxID=429009 RepID=C9R9T5_AMMDK|nr:efflux RND transporter periplasmic adaptor subunit [Ammonifex degensii]ACX53064.1 efflux transporter, RND family, MFP subunit [Ammonifex degensii KC4]